MLEPDRPLQEVRKCMSCDGPADFVMSCCNLQLCAYCLHDGFKARHTDSAGASRVCCAKGAIGIIDTAKDFVELDDEGHICCNTMVVQELLDRTYHRDSFVFRRMEPLSSLWVSGNDSASRSSTEVYHVRNNGTLWFLCKFLRRFLFLP